jgi:hypothetical protein
MAWLAERVEASSGSQPPGNLDDSTAQPYVFLHQDLFIHNRYIRYGLGSSLGQTPTRPHRESGDSWDMS